ncbi:hypothetical protein V3G39_17490 [Dermatophilaceae bacterium Sec6.4]
MSDSSSAGDGSPQDRYYQRYTEMSGSSGSSDGGPGRGPTRMVKILVAIVAVVVAIVVAVIATTWGSSSGEASPSSTAGTASSTPSTDGTRTGSGSSGTTTVAGALKVRPVVPGWQAVGGLVNDRNTIKAAYDAPPNWKVTQDGSIVFKNETVFGKATTWGLAAYNAGKCPGHPRGIQASASFIDIGKRDPVEAVTSIMAQFGSAASLNKDKTTHASQGDLATKTVTVGGNIPAVRGDLKVTEGTLGDDCGVGKSMLLQGVAFSANDTSVFLLISVATWPGQVTPPTATIDKIFSSLRPVSG